jgi:hypothetical protein
MKKPLIIHDLKNERPDLTPPLPGVMTVLPFIFYVTVVGSVALGAMSIMATKKATKATETAVASEGSEQAQSLLIQSELNAINEELSQAKEVESWVHSTQPLMNMLTSIINSVKTGNTLTSLQLARTPENPEHVEITLLVNNGGSAQVEETRNALGKEGFQAFREDTKSADKSTRLGDMTYTAVYVNTRNPK